MKRLMKLYLITPVVPLTRYATYDSAVVAARGPQEARSQHPGADNCGFWGSASWVSGPGFRPSTLGGLGVAPRLGWCVLRTMRVSEPF